MVGSFNHEKDTTMTQPKTDLNRTMISQFKQALMEDSDFLRPLIQTVAQELLEEEMNEAIGARKGERTVSRLSYRSGHYPRTLVTRVGKIELMVPQDREGRFSTAIFERYQRSEKALVSALIEMYIQGVSTRKVGEVAKELCGHDFSASAVSRMNKTLDGELERFARRRLEVEYPYLIVDARYEKVRIDGVIRDCAVLVAVGINWDGRREILGVEQANRESHTSWKDFIICLKKRGLSGVRLVITDDHAGLRKAIREVLPEALWQRCYVHFLRNALDHLPRKADDDCLQELRWIYDRRDTAEARRDLLAWIERWASRYRKLVDWVEQHIEETFTFYSFPRAHHKHVKSTNMLERFNQELKRRSHVVRIFPNEAALLRLIRALCVETHEDWIEAHRYLNMTHLRDHLKIALEADAA